MTRCFIVECDLSLTSCLKVPVAIYRFFAHIDLQILILFCIRDQLLVGVFFQNLKLSLIYYSINFKFFPSSEGVLKFSYTGLSLLHRSTPSAYLFGTITSIVCLCYASTNDIQSGKFSLESYVMCSFLSLSNFELQVFQRCRESSIVWCKGRQENQ